MRKTKHFFLALLAVTTLSTAWASGLSGNKPDNDPAKTTYTVQWTGETDVVYDGQPQNGISATYNDGTTDHQLTLTYTNGTVTTTTAPVNAGAWTVIANSPSGVSLTGTTTMLNIQPAPVYVTGAAAEIAKFADGTLIGVVTNNGVLNGVFGNDPIGHVTSAVFDNGSLGTGKTITLHYALTSSNPTMLNNYVVTPTSQFYTDNGVVIANMLPNTTYGQSGSGIDISTTGYCTGNSYFINYRLASGLPDQYRIDFADGRFTDIPWTDLTVAGQNGTMNVLFPNATVPSGNYAMTIYFRDSRYPALESNPFNVTFNVNLSSDFTKPLFDNVIALVDTCNCFENIQWYHNGVAIPGANGYFYREEGGLTGDYYITATMNGVPTATCPQNNLTTLISDENMNATVAAHPNPTVDNVTITIDGSESFIHTYTVVSTLGVEMMRGAFEGNHFTIDMRSFQHGNYMVNVDGNVVRVIKN